MHFSKIKFASLIVAVISVCPIGAQALQISADSAVLYDTQSDTYYYEKNADEQRGMASTTKIMTAIVALENSLPDEMVDVKYEHTAIEGSKMYLKSGEQISMHELLCGLLLSSGNDAAMAIAEHISEETEQFAELMNEKADQLDLKVTSFENPSGLDGENHHTTARELAKIGAYAMSMPQFYEIVSSKTIKTENGRVLSNHNKMLKLYEYADGVKTGFTKKSGRCLVSSATKNGRRLISVTLDAPDDWNDHIKMFDYGFSLFEEVKIFDKNQEICQAYVAGGKKAKIYTADEVVLSLTEQEKNSITKVVIGKHMVYTPIEVGQKYGEMVIMAENREVARVNLLFSQSFAAEQEKKDTFFDRLAKWLNF